MSAYLTGVEHRLRAQEESGLDLAVARLADRPDLAVAVMRGARSAVPARVASASPHFAAPPPR